jgi:nucleoid-associated protein
MPLEHAIVHHLRRNAEGEVQLTLRSEELPLEGHSESLFGQLKRSFLARISREHGSFNREDQAAALPQGLRAYLDKELDFVALSRKLMEQLKQRVEESRIELDVHCFFYIEKSLDHHLFHLFATQQSASLTLNDRLEPVPSYAIDTGPSLFGIKVDLAEWQERQDYAYLSLLPPRGNPALSEAFTQLSGFANGLNKKEATLAFLEGVEAYARELPAEKVDEYRNKVVEYCMEREEQDAPVELKSLAGSMEEIDADAFVRTVGDHTAGEQPEVMLDRRSLKRYVKLAGREKDLAISFNSYQLNKRVQYDEQSDTLSINGVPKALRKQLLEHLKEN